MKRLDIDERMLIQACLTNKMSLTEISKRLNRNKSTISREISKHLVEKFGVFKKDCNHKHFTCNFCPYKRQCKYDKKYYNYKTAQQDVDNLKTKSRSKSRLSKKELSLIDDILINEVRTLKQSLHHVYVANPVLSKICSERTIRRLIYRRELSVKACELRKYVVYKHEYKKEVNANLRDIRVIIGRQYSDYINYVKNHKRLNIVQYDSVIGRITDTRAILTITLPKYGFQFGLMINKSDPLSVRNQLLNLFSKLGKELTRQVFAINLADNGVEFSKFNEIEYWSDGEKICRTYFTNPYRATDKAACERYHEYVRYLIPKGKTLNSISQDQLNWMYSQINSMVRKSLHDQTPYDLVRRKFGEEFLNIIGIKRVEKKKVTLHQIL